jgi:hypothetical protein
MEGRYSSGKGKLVMKWLRFGGNFPKIAKVGGNLGRKEGRLD